MTWHVVLDGEPDVFGAIAEEYTEPELMIIRQVSTTEWLLCSTILDAHSDLEVVRSETERLVELVSGITRATHGLDEPFVIVELRKGMAVVEGHRLPGTRAARWAALANRDPIADRVIRAFANPSWIEYRLIVDTIEAAGCDPVDRGWALDRELLRLKATCDAFTAEPFRPVKSTMMPRAAESLVRRLVQRWLGTLSP